MKVGVLALQGAVSEHICAVRNLGFEALPVKTREELDAVDGLIIPGGESTTMIRLINKYDLKDKIIELNAKGVPIYGTCAGMILIAKRVGNYNQETLGLLDVTVVRNAFGRQIDSMEVDLEVKGLNHPFHAIFIRAPVAKDPGEGVEVLAAVEEGIVFVRQGNILASSFHPELGEDTRIHKMFIDMILSKS